MISKLRRWFAKQFAPITPNTVTMNKNQHITEFLEYYLALENSPEYAVMLQGTWGSGKTWYIKDFISNHKDIKFLRISLYGITSYKEIENILFELLHPILSSKAAKITGKILSGVLKTTLKIDLDGNKGSSDLSTTVSIPEFVKDFDKQAENAVLIFDDLERCSIKTVDILGYINQYVENYGLKVILLANEEELRKKDDQNKDAETTAYKSIKEKLIGKTFNIEADLQAALGVFIGQVRTQDLQKLLMRHKPLLESTYITSGYHNLRHLKQSIMDFDRFYDFLPDDLDKKPGLTEHLIAMFFALSIEVKKGDITNDQVPRIFLMDYLTRNPKDELTPVQKIANKYPVLGAYNHPLDGRYFQSFFNQGCLDKAEVEQAIKQSFFYLEDRKPTWAKLLEFFTMEDTDFKSKLSEVWIQLETDKVQDKYVLLHIVALFLQFSKNGLLSEPVEKIKALASKTIRSLQREGKLILVQGEKLNLESAFTVQYYKSADPDFIAISNELKNAVDNAEAADLSKKAALLLESLKQSNDSLFLTQLTLTNSPQNIYFDTPILHQIDPTEFVEAFLALSNKRKHYFFNSLEVRYKYPDYNKKLKIEEDWWKEVFRILSTKQDDFKLSITGLLLDRVIVAIDKFIDILKTTDKNGNTIND